MKTTFLRGAFVAAGALIITAVVASAQQSGTVDPRTVPEFKAEFDRAAKLGLPVGPLESQARKGYLMQASLKANREAVRGLADRMLQAREALKPHQGDPELEAGALALHNDVPARVLRNLRQVQKTRSIEVPLGVLTELMARGVPLQQAAAKVEEMVRASIPNGRMIAMAAEVQADVAGGIAPTVALDLRSKGVLSLPQAGLPGALAPATQSVRPPPR